MITPGRDSDTQFSYETQVKLQQRIDALTAQLAEARAEADALHADVREWIKENGPGGWIYNLRAEVERLRGHLTFLGAKETEEGLEIDMPKYHKAHREPGYEELKAEVERLTSRCIILNTSIDNLHDEIRDRDAEIKRLKESPCPKR